MLLSGSPAGLMAMGCLLCHAHAATLQVRTFNGAAEPCMRLVMTERERNLAPTLHLRCIGPGNPLTDAGHESSRAAMLNAVAFSTAISTRSCQVPGICDALSFARQGALISPICSAGTQSSSTSSSMTRGCSMDRPSGCCEMCTFLTFLTSPSPALWSDVWNGCGASQVVQPVLYSRNAV